MRIKAKRFHVTLAVTTNHGKEILEEQKLVFGAADLSGYQRWKEERKRMGGQRLTSRKVKGLPVEKWIMLHETINGHERATLKVCGQCNHIYAIVGDNRSSGSCYCSPECQRKDKAQRQSERRLEQRAKDRPTRYCENCGLRLESQRITKRFCDDHCRQTARRNRQR